MNLADIYSQKLASGALRPDEDQQQAITVLAALGERLVRKPERPSFWAARKIGRRPLPSRSHPLAEGGAYLHGGVGRGKTMVMDLFFASAPPPKRRVHFHAFMLELHDFLHERRGKKTEAIDGGLIAFADHVAKEARLLCFDEFFVKDVADAMILGRLFTALFERDVRVVMTSNSAPDDLYLDGLQRDRFLPFIALLKEKLEVVHFTGGTDYRLNRLRGAKTYYWPHDADARAEMEKTFLAVADGEEGTALDIGVKGRLIHVPRAAKEIAWFTFRDICETEKSAVDYLELVKTFRAFVVENVPHLDDRHHNAVLRFITFIDTLYDHRARLVLSAAAAPEGIYTGEMHAAAFRRTVSRLLEMQSKDYGGTA